MARPRSAPPAFDPRALIATLDRHRVDYVVVGALARVLHGTAEVTDELDITLSLKERNLQRLGKALAEIAPDVLVKTTSLTEPAEAVLRLDTVYGRLALVPRPAGTGGYDDLKRAAVREHLGEGLRPSVASSGDLGRMLNTLRRDRDLANLSGLRRAEELQIALGRGIQR